MSETKSALEILKEFNDKNKGSASQHISEFGDYYKNYLNGNSGNRVQTGDAYNKYNSASNKYDNYLNQGYKPSDQVNSNLNYSNKYANQMNNMGEFKYDNKYGDKIQGYLDQYDKSKFSYDINSDPLYQQLAESFQQKGKQAMIDTMGQASAMTGGYGSSYASSVGQQAYQQNLNELNSVAPQLAEMAYAQYSDSQQKTLNLASFYNDMENGDYEKALSSYQTNLSRYNDLMSYYQSQYQYMDSAERNQYSVMLDAYNNQMNQAYKAYEGALGQDNYENTMQYNIAQSKAEQADREKSYAWELAQRMADQKNKDRDFYWGTAKDLADYSNAEEQKQAQTADENTKIKGSYATPDNIGSAEVIARRMLESGESSEAVKRRIYEWGTKGNIDLDVGSKVLIAKLFS